MYLHKTKKKSIVKEIGHIILIHYIVCPCRVRVESVTRRAAELIAGLFAAARSLSSAHPDRPVIQPSGHPDRTASDLTANETDTR